MSYKYPYKYEVGQFVFVNTDYGVLELCVRNRGKELPAEQNYYELQILGILWEDLIHKDALTARKSRRCTLAYGASKEYLDKFLVPDIPDAAEVANSVSTVNSVNSDNASPKILILGHGRHGKDTVAQVLKEMWNFSFKSSSEAALDIFLYEELLRLGFEYESPQEAFEDRVNHRQLWKDKITEYNERDRSRLAREIMKTNNIYVGMRCELEFEACMKEGVFDTILYVDSYVKDKDSTFKIKFDPTKMILIKNWGDPRDLIVEVAGAMKVVYNKEGLQ